MKYLLSFFKPCNHLISQLRYRATGRTSFLMRQLRMCETNYREVSCFYAFIYFQFFLYSFLSLVHASFLPLCFQCFCHFLANYSHPSFFPFLTLTLHSLYFFSLFFYIFWPPLAQCIFFIVNSQRCNLLVIHPRCVRCIQVMSKDSQVKHNQFYRYL